MASWDPAAEDGAGVARTGLRCLACGRPLDESLALAGSLRCLDCRASNAALKIQLTPGPERTVGAGDTSGPHPASER
jgi:hypothetical protein